MRPRVERAGDLPPGVGVGAGVLARAAVADVCLRAIAHQPSLLVEVMGPQVLALRATPVVELLVVGESGAAITERAPVRMGGEPFEERGGAEQEGAVSGDHQGFRAHVNRAAEASSAPAFGTPSGWSTSVKRMSSGSSSVTRSTVWRMPR